MGQLDQVPENSVLPKADIIARIASLKKVRSASGKLMFKSEFRVQETGAGTFVNMPLFEQYVIGSDKDPDAENQKTWNEAAGARNMKRLLKKLDLDTTKDIDQLIVEAEGREIGLSITRFEEPAKKKVRQDGMIKEIDNEYAGQLRNRISNYWTPGEKVPAIFEEEETGTVELEARPAATTTTRTSAARTAKAATQPAAVDEEPVATVAPKAAAKPNGAAAAATAAGAAAAAEKILNCPECNEQMPKSQFMAHVSANHA